MNDSGRSVLLWSRHGRKKEEIGYTIGEDMRGLSPLSPPCSGIQGLYWHCFFLNFKREIAQCSGVAVKKQLETT